MGCIVIESTKSSEVKFIRPFETVNFDEGKVDLPMPIDDKEKSE